MIKYICDRCQKQIDPTKFNAHDKFIYRIYKYDPTTIPNQYDGIKIDLCMDCYEKLVDFIHCECIPIK